MVIVRLPIPNDRLVALTIAGALATMVVAGALAVPGAVDGQDGAVTGGGQQTAADAPTPNQQFTPAVQTESGGDYDGEEYENEEYEDEAEDEAHGDGEGLLE